MGEGGYQCPRRLSREGRSRSSVESPVEVHGLVCKPGDLSVTDTVNYHPTEGPGAFTCSMKTYSITTDATFMPSVVYIAISVDAIATREMVRGPMSLQNKSIRRIRAFMPGTW